MTGGCFEQIVQMPLDIAVALIEDPILALEAQLGDRQAAPIRW